MPSDQMFDALRQAESVFNFHVDSVMRVDGVKRRLSGLMLGCFEELSSCATNDRICKLFLNVCLHHALSLCNAELSESTQKRRSRKYIKLSQ